MASQAAPRAISTAAKLPCFPDGSGLAWDILADADDPQASMFRHHRAGNLPQKLFVFAEHFGYMTDGKPPRIRAERTIDRHLRLRRIIIIGYICLRKLPE